MGATAVGLVEVEQDAVPHWVAFNIGDCRLYRLDRATLTQLTVDHSYVQALVDGGVLDPGGARTHPLRSLVTKALGIGDSHEPDFWLFPAEPGSRFLLCSDGLTSEVEDDAIAVLLGGPGGPQDAADRLVGAALAAAGRDNVSVVVVEVVSVGTGTGRRPLRSARPNRRRGSARTLWIGHWLGVVRMGSPEFRKRGPQRPSVSAPFRHDGQVHWARTVGYLLSRVMRQITA